MPTYNRTEITEAAQSFYAFLATLPAMDPTRIMVPPDTEKGWSSFDRIEVLADEPGGDAGPGIGSDSNLTSALASTSISGSGSESGGANATGNNSKIYKTKKTPRVLDLLRHLPYLKLEVDWRAEIGDVTQPIPWCDDEMWGDAQEGEDAFRVEWEVGEGEREDEAEPELDGEHFRLPPSVVQLTDCTHRDGGHKLFLDTEDGSVTDYERNGSPPSYDHTEYFSSPEYWRNFQRYDKLSQIFDSWKEKFMKLEWIQVPGWHNKDFEVVAEGPMPPMEMQDFRDIYLAHGWPDAFDRDGCIKALLARQGK